MTIKGSHFENPLFGIVVSDVITHTWIHRPAMVSWRQAVDSFEWQIQEASEDQEIQQWQFYTIPGTR